MADRRYNCIARRGRRSRGLQGSRGAHGRAPAAPPAGRASRWAVTGAPGRGSPLRSAVVGGGACAGLLAPRRACGGSSLWCAVCLPLFVRIREGVAALRRFVRMKLQRL